jgi:hypothetical protein
LCSRKGNKRARETFFLKEQEGLKSLHWKFIKSNQESYRKPQSLQKFTRRRETGIHETKRKTKKIKTITESALAITQLQESIFFGSP